MARVGAAPDAIVADQAKSDGPINGPINMRVLQFVREHAGCKRADIANGIGVSLRSLKRALEGLSAEIQYRGSKKNRRVLPKGVKAWSVRRGFAGADPARGAFYG